MNSLSAKKALQDRYSWEKRKKQSCFLTSGHVLPASLGKSILFYPHGLRNNIWLLETGLVEQVQLCNCVLDPPWDFTCAPQHRVVHFQQCGLNISEVWSENDFVIDQLESHCKARSLRVNVFWVEADHKSVEILSKGIFLLFHHVWPTQFSNLW